MKYGLRYTAMNSSFGTFRRASKMLRPAACGRFRDSAFRRRPFSADAAAVCRTGRAVVKFLLFSYPADLNAETGIFGSEFNLAP